MKLKRNRRQFAGFPFVLVAALVLGATAGFAAQPERERPLSFASDVVPILTKASCNSGGCHAKAGNGQNGFRLSLLGFEPREDYEHIVKEGHGRRVFPAAPEQSLLLLKASNVVPHGGGKRLDPGSESYQRLARWIGQGLAYGNPADPTVASISVEPKRSVLPVHTQKQLKVRAHYSDGHAEDVTRLALYEPNDKAMAEVDDQGLVTMQDIPGTVAVMVRYQGMVAVALASIPLGAPVDQTPPETNFIDSLVFANLKELGIPPSPVCDDATFLRRASLDIAGRLPTVEEVGAFSSSTEPAKRDRLIESLLASPDYADYFANKWTALLRNKRDDTSDIRANFAFHSWVRDGLLENKPYDQMVRELLAATGTIADNPAVAWYKRVREPQQQLEDVAQLFLGVRVQCAQCHHHPFERWSQNDYYSFGAFFSRVGRKPTAIRDEDVIFHKRGLAQLENKKTKAPVKPAVLGGSPLEIAPDEDPRLKLADWMSDKTNPFFAKSLVNRYWKHFFNRGLVEPEDDLRETNPATNPALLDALASHFVSSGYDLKDLVRLIVRSNTYQLSAIPNAFNRIDQQNFSHYYPRRLQAEVLLDAIDQLTGARTDFANLPPGTRAIALPDNSYNRTAPFLKVFGRPEGASVCECERVQAPSLAQSLHLMNASEVKRKLGTPGGRAETLARSSRPEAEAEAENLRTLYLAAYGREPDAEERAVAEAYIARPRTDAQGKPLDRTRARREAYEDLLWALINTKEFLYNH